MLFRSLTLQGFTKPEAETVQYSAVNHHDGPSFRALDILDFPLRLKEALNTVGHPLALLHPDLKDLNHEHNFYEIVEGWITQEAIYRVLWPELNERNDVTFGYLRSSYDGDQFFFSCKGVEFEHHFERDSLTYNSMSYPLIDRPWAETVEEVDIEIGHELFSYHDVLELFDFFDFDSEIGSQLILAAIISKNAWTQEVLSPQYVLTQKGEQLVCEQAQYYFEDDRDMRVVIQIGRAHV